MRRFVRLFIWLTTEKVGRSLFLVIGIILPIIGSLLNVLLPQSISDSKFEVPIFKVEVPLIVAIGLLLKILIIIFLLYAFYVALLVYLTPEKRAQALAKAYHGKSDVALLFFTKKKIEKWLEGIFTYLKYRFNIEQIEAIENDLIKNLSTNNLENILSKRFYRILKVAMDTRLSRKIVEDAKLLDALLDEAAGLFKIPRIVLESLLSNINIGVCQKIVEESNSTYELIRVAKMSSNIDRDDLLNDAKNEILTLKEKMKRLEKLKNWFDRLNQEDEMNIKEILGIIRDTSTGRATLGLSKFLHRIMIEKPHMDESALERIRFLVELANSRIGYPISELLELTIVNNKLHWDKKLLDNDNVNFTATFLQKFKVKRADALVKLEGQIKEKYKLFVKDKKVSICVALTFGYSSVLKNILSILIDFAKVKKVPEEKIMIWLISAENSQGEEVLLKTELETKYSDLKCKIIPIESVLKTNLYIDKIFVGIECININGLLVHPRGGSELIDKIRRQRSKLKVFAFGETYKVRKFTEEDINYQKLFSVDSKYIDFVFTDCGIHERVVSKEGTKWKINNRIEKDLSCCFNHWDRIKKRV